MSSSRSKQKIEQKEGEEEEEEEEEEEQNVADVDAPPRKKKRGRSGVSLKWVKKSSDEEWNAMFVRLALWKNEHPSENGKIMIEKDDMDDGELASWANYQRREFSKAALDANNGYRRKALDAIGFCWNLKEERDRLRFEERFQKLVDYKKEHGDLRIPTKTHELSSWVNSLRTSYLHKQQAQRGELKDVPKHKPLSDEIEARLNAIGFIWNCAGKRVGWDSRFQELKDYKERFGDCKVPQHWPENKRLGKWVAKQRAEYNLLQQGKPSYTLDEERIAQLNEVEFDWGKARPNARKENNNEFGTMSPV